MSERLSRRGLLSLGGALVAGVLLAGFAAAPDVVFLKRPPSHPRDLPTARFSHVEHGSFGCYECHPGLFSTPQTSFTHDLMKKGQACGACHDGSFARSIPQLGCKSCHVK